MSPLGWISTTAPTRIDDDAGGAPRLAIVNVVGSATAPAGTSRRTPYSGLVVSATSTLPPSGPIVALAASATPLTTIVVVICSVTLPSLAQTMTVSPPRDAPLGLQVVSPAASRVMPAG